MFKNLNEKDKKKISWLICLAVVCGISLIAISGLEKEEVISKDESNDIVQEDINNELSKSTLEEKLKNILSQIEGAGELDVMITYESSEEIQPAFNTNTTTEKTKEVDQQGGERTVTTSSENKTMITSSSSEPIVIKTNQPKINGVIVVASGAKDPTVKETLYSAVQTALQVQGHQVEIYTK
ncbi:MAG: stage III sporulation protein AG [Romboutsia sp.]|nr:stage III sporulation protein AG [Romboutsia sp.]